MNPFTLRKLEYEKIREMLAAECSSSLGRQVAEALEPGTDSQQIHDWQQETTEGVTVRRLEPNIPLGGVGVAAPARWRMGWRTEEAGRSAEVVMPPMVYEWGNGGEGGSQTLGRACLKCGKVTNLSPV